MRQTRKPAMYCWSILLLHLVIDADGWVTAPLKTSLIRSRSTSRNSLPEKNSVHADGAKRKKMNRQQRKPDCYAESSWSLQQHVFSQPNFRSSQMQWASFRRITRQRRESALYATSNDDDLNEQSSKERNETTTNSTDFLRLEEKLNQTGVIKNQSVPELISSNSNSSLLESTNELQPNASSASLTDRKSADKQPISSAARVFAGLFGELNTSQTILNETNNSSVMQRESKQAKKAARRKTLSQQVGDDDLNVSALVLEPENSTDKLMLDATDSPSSTLSVQNSSSLVTNNTSALGNNNDVGESIVSKDASILLQDNSTILSSQDSAKTLLEDNEVKVTESATSSGLVTSGLDEKVAKSAVKKKAKFKVTWLDAPVQSVKRKEFPVTKEPRAANLTVASQQINSTINSTGKVKETDTAPVLNATSKTNLTKEATEIDQFLDDITSTQVLDTNLTYDVSSTNSTSSASIANNSFAVEEKPIKAISAASSLGSSVLDSGDLNSTLDADVNLTAYVDVKLTSGADLIPSADISDSQPAENAEAVMPVYTELDIALSSIESVVSDKAGFGSVSPSSLMPDDIFAPPSTNFEPGSPPAPLLPKDSAAPVIPKFEPGSPPAPLLPEDNVAPVSPVYEPRSPPAPLLPNDSLVPGSPKFEPGSPPAPLLPKDTFSPATPYKSETPANSQEFDPTKPPKNFGSFVQEIAKDMMPDFGGASAKPAAGEFGSFVREVAKGSMPIDESRGSDTPKPASEFGAYVEEVAKESLPEESEQGGTPSNPTVIVDNVKEADAVAEEWDPRKPPSNFGSFVNNLAKSRMSGSGDGDFDSGTGILDTTTQEEQMWEDNFPGPDPYVGTSDQDNSADMYSSSSQRTTNSYDRAETWDPWKFDVMSQTLGKSANFPSSTLEDFSGSGLEISAGGRSSPGRGTQSSFERAETWDPWKFDVMSQTLGKSTHFASSYPGDFPAAEETTSDFYDNQQFDSSGYASQAPPDSSFDRAKNWDPWKFDVMSQTLGKSTMFPSSSPEDFVNTGISTSSTGQVSGASRDSSTGSSFQRAETWDPWKFDVLSQTLGKSTHFPSSAPQDFSTGDDQSGQPPSPQPGQRMISYEKTESWDPRTFNVLSQTLGKSTSFPVPETPLAPSNDPSWANDSTGPSESSSSGSFSRAEKWDPWAFDVLKQTLGKSTIFPSSTPQDFSGNGSGGGFGNEWGGSPQESPQESRFSGPLGPSSSTYSPQGVFNRPKTVSGTFDPSGSLSGAGRPQSTGQGPSTSSWNSESSARSSGSGSIADYSQPNGVFDPTSQSRVTSYLQDATKAHFGNAPRADEDSFPSQNSQFSSDFSEGRFKMLTGEAAPLHWDPIRETWVEQGTGKPVASTFKSEITPPKKQEQVSVTPLASPSKEKDTQSKQQTPPSSLPAVERKSASEASNNPQSDNNMDRKKFFADLFEKDSKPSDDQAPSATVYDGDTSRDAIFGNQAPQSSRKPRGKPNKPVAPSVNVGTKAQGRSTVSRSDAGNELERRLDDSSVNSVDQKQRRTGKHRVDRAYDSNSNREAIFSDFLRNNYQPGSLRMDIPENVFGGNRKSEYIDNTANRGFGPFQGGWGQPPIVQNRPADDVFIDLPSEEEQRQGHSPSDMYRDSPLFERDGPSSDAYRDSSLFERDGPSSDAYRESARFERDDPASDVYRESARFERNDLSSDMSESPSLERNGLSSGMSDSSPFERNGTPSDMYREISPFASDDSSPGSYSDASSFKSEDPPFEMYREELSPERYFDGPPADFSGSFPPLRGDDGDLRAQTGSSYFDSMARSSPSDDSQSSNWQNNGGSYLDSMRRTSDEESNESDGVFDWGSYVSEQENTETSSSTSDFPAEDPDGYYIANPTLYDSGSDDYPPVISFAEASRPQMRSYLDSLYKSSQSNGYWDSASKDTLFESQEQSYESPEQAASYESEKQSSSIDFEKEQSFSMESQDPSSSLADQGESRTQPTTPYFSNTEWNPKEGTDPNQNPFARFVYTDSDSQTSSNQYTGGDSNGEDSPAPKRGSQVYPEVKNSWFGGGSYLDSMSQRQRNEEQNNLN